MGLPHPTPNTDDSGIDFSMSVSYPISFDEAKGEIIASTGPQQLEEGPQQDSVLPFSAIFPYCSIIFYLNCRCLSTDIGLQKKLIELVRVNGKVSEVK